MPENSLHANTQHYLVPLHQQILDWCLETLDRAKFIVPDLDDPNSDRITYVDLDDHDIALAHELIRQYETWVNTYIAEAAEYLSPREQNHLQSNATMILTFIQLKRRGQDTPVEMYKRFFRFELLELIKQQELIYQSVEGRQNRPNMARRRSYWMQAPLTIGVEEEHQIVSTRDWELAHDVDTILASVASPQFGREVYRSQIELNTGVCDSIQDVDTSLRQLREQLQSALPAGLRVGSAGTHPFSTWNAQQANQSARTDLFMHDMQDVVRRLVTFGLHVHIGVSDPELAVEVVNAARRFLPLLLALSSSSPFWEGRVTGLSSYRSTVFACLPRTGIPPTFRDSHGYESYLRLLADTHSFDSVGSFDPTKIWWDIRLHPRFPTIEFRVCDACTRVADAVSIASLCQALVAKLVKLHHHGMQLRHQRIEVTQENKWRAIRYGTRARFIDDLSRQEVTAQFMLLQLLDLIEDVVVDLGTADFVTHALRIISEGSSADEQERVFSKSRSTQSVVQWIVDEFSPSAS